MRPAHLLYLAALIALLSTPTAGRAHTWHVARDGSGDFTVIQDAVDAASDGDTIHIHAGRYPEYVDDYEVWGEGSHILSRVHVAVTKENLTLQGDGHESTIIGPETSTTAPGLYYGITATHYHANTLTMRDLALENMEDGVMGWTRYLEITGCRFETIPHEGVELYTTEGAHISNTIFADIGNRGISAFAEAESVVIEDCYFDDCVGGVRIGGVSASVRSCEFVGGITPVDYQFSATGSVSDCSMTGYSNYGLAVLDGAHVEFRDCTMSDGGAALWVGGQAASASGSGCVFVGNTYATVIMSHGHLELHDTDIINGGGFSVLCEGWSMDPYHIDLTNNYWGTDSADQIAEWIWDATDDPQLSCTVDYFPFQGVVSVEPRTLSDVKELFRD